MFVVPLLCVRRVGIPASPQSPSMPWCGQPVMTNNKTIKICRLSMVHLKQVSHAYLLASEASHRCKDLRDYTILYAHG